MASRVAEVIFTAQSTFDQAKAFRDDIRARAVAWGRNPDHLKIMPGAVVVVGDSRQEAEDKWAELQGLIDLNTARASLELALKGFDLSGFDLDSPFPDVPPESVVIRSSASNAHFAVIGSAQDVADQLQYWFEEGACDGFNFMPS